MLILSEKWDWQLAVFARDLPVGRFRTATAHPKRGSCLDKYGLGAKLGNTCMWVFHCVMRVEPPGC